VIYILTRTTANYGAQSNVAVAVVIVRRAQYTGNPTCLVALQLVTARGGCHKGGLGHPRRRRRT